LLGERDGEEFDVIRAIELRILVRERETRRKIGFEGG
jgi:hypothetical protein